MSLDFQQVRQQIKQMGENARQNALRKSNQINHALNILLKNAGDLERLHQKVKHVAHMDANLRCALPVLPAPDRQPEPLDGHYPLPALPESATILAADGSQIAPDRHAPVNYCLINVGAILLRLGASQAPEISITSQLLYDDELYIKPGFMLTEARLALIRDLNERKRLAELAKHTSPPVVTFTDGPMELWGGKEEQGEENFKESLEAYLDVLRHLQELGVATAGYVDKPAATLVTRLLEVTMTAEEDLPGLRDNRPLHPVTDKDLFERLLSPGERSAVFGIQSRSSARYSGGLALHFFYLNVGRQDHPWLARVEIPAWVLESSEMLDFLHAALVQQCRVMGSRPYPYVLHRAHEAAVVKLEEKDQVTQMIAMELRQRGVELGEISNKQSSKDLPGRTAYKKR